VTIEPIVQRDVRTLSKAALCAEAARAMRDANVGSLVVVDADGFPEGILTDRDLAIRVLADGKRPDQPVTDAMTREPIFLPETAPLHEALATMRDLRFRRLIVVDEHKRLVGIVSTDDVLLHLGEALADLSQVIRSELRRTPTD